MLRRAILLPSLSKKETKKVIALLHASKDRIIARIQETTRLAKDVRRNMLTWTDVEEVLSLPPGFCPRK